MMFLVMAAGCGSENSKKEQQTPNPPTSAEIDSPPMPEKF